MKSNNLILMLCLTTTLLLFNGCGGKKYADVRDVLEDYTKVMDDYITKLDKSENAGDVTKAMNSFADQMEKIAPKMKKISDKYPELKNSDNPPEELKDLQGKAEESGRKIVNAMMKIMPYMNDPEVQKAQERMSTAMMILQE